MGRQGLFPLRVLRPQASPHLAESLFLFRVGLTGAKDLDSKGFQRVPISDELVQGRVFNVSQQAAGNRVQDLFLRSSKTPISSMVWPTSAPIRNSEPET